jgi:sec-independent protein translocase protein TatA
MLFPKIGPVELILILVIVTMLFGVGKLPEVFGSVGKGIREFRKAANEPEPPKSAQKPEAPKDQVEVYDDGASTPTTTPPSA